MFNLVPPTAQEIQARTTAESLVILYRSLHIKCPVSYAQAANNHYGDVDLLPDMSTKLHNILSHLKAHSPGLFHQIVYRNTASSRKLASWWNSHSQLAGTQ